VLLWDSSRDQFTMFTVKRNDSNEDKRETETERKKRKEHQKESNDLHLVQVGVHFHSVFSSSVW